MPLPTKYLNLYDGEKSMDDQLRDALLQSIVLVLIAAAFLFAIYRLADTTMLELRFFGKDAGTLAEGIQASKGDVQLTYTELPATHTHIFNFTTQKAVGLFLASQKNTSQIKWTIFQRYGRTGPQGFELTETQLIYPSLIEYRRTGSTISFLEGAAGNCLGGATLNKAETRLVLASFPPPVETQLGQFANIAELSQNLLGKQTIAITFAQGPAAIEFSGPDSSGAAQLACLLQARLAETYPGIAATNKGQSVTEIRITLTLPELQGAQDATLAQAIALSLKDFVRGGS